MKRLGLSAALAAFFALGCGGADMTAASPSHDMLVAADEPRAELALKIDLAPEQGCEEAFDLELYKDRGIDLVQWDASTGACRGRVVTIRYLSKKLSADAVFAAAGAHAVKVERVAKK